LRQLARTLRKVKFLKPQSYQITVVVDAEQTDEFFSFIFFQGELNKPGEVLFTRLH